MFVFVLAVLISTLLWLFKPATFQAVLMIAACAYFLAWALEKLFSLIAGEIAKHRKPNP